jgi:uncharacterized protein YbjT (DUF2867 family)
VGVSAPRILLAGATGLVGERVLGRLLDDPGSQATVLAPVRRPLHRAHPRLQAPVLDFTLGDEDFAQALDAIAPGPLDAFVCCLGTTLRAAGSREAFIAVDRELVLRMSRIARARGARHAVLVSSVGASRQSANFYLRVKGEVEDAMEQAGYARLDILRPSLLLGPRSQRRTAEAVFQRLAPAANWLLHGRFRPYRAIHADAVARAIVALLPRTEPGVFGHDHASLMELAGD